MHDEPEIARNKRKKGYSSRCRLKGHRRVYQHKQEIIAGFTKQYSCKQLVYYERGDSMMGAIEREKQIKGGSRKKKLALIENMNPRWIDLYETLL